MLKERTFKGSCKCPFLGHKLRIICLNPNGTEALPCTLNLPDHLLSPKQINDIHTMLCDATK